MNTLPFIYSILALKSHLRRTASATACVVHELKVIKCIIIMGNITATATWLQLMQVGLQRRHCSPLRSAPATSPATYVLYPFPVCSYVTTYSISVDHALSCPTRGYTAIRHNEVRHLTYNPWQGKPWYTRLPTQTLVLGYIDIGLRFLGSLISKDILWCQGFRPNLMPDQIVSLL